MTTNECLGHLSTSELYGLTVMPLFIHTITVTATGRPRNANQAPPPKHLQLARLEPAAAVPGSPFQSKCSRGKRLVGSERGYPQLPSIAPGTMIEDLDVAALA